ncbi:MAG: PD40 domain-containing protein [Anaerolineae bacterium]|nr:PD40 domain-containing protein [Anaerolineae bacterium]
MRRLLTWITILMACASLLLIGIRAVHSDSPPTACIQLISPSTGDVLTVDASSDAALLDARNDFPLPLPDTNDTYLTTLSPDHTHLIEAIAQTNAGLPVQLWLGRRSTTFRRLLTPRSVAARFVWSPDSQHLAFIEMHNWASSDSPVKLTLVGADGNSIQRETIPNNVEDSWLTRSRYFVWSPDSTMIALTMYFSSIRSESTLALRSIDSAQSIYVPFPNQEIVYVTWSPNNQYILVFTNELATSPFKGALHVIQRNGQLLQKINLSSIVNLDYLSNNNKTVPTGLQWSSDGHYLFVTVGFSDAPQVDIVNIDGDHPVISTLNSLDRPLLWLAQPHTLVYTTESANRETFHTLDVTTGQANLLATAVLPQYWRWIAPDFSALSLITNNAPNRYSLRLISLASDRIEVPFGEFQSITTASSMWSPNSQKLMIISEEEATFTIRWLLRNSTEIKQFKFPKQSAADEKLLARWLTNDVMLLTHVIADRTVEWVLDTYSMKAIQLFSTFRGTDYYFDLQGGRYATVTTQSGVLLYRLTDGAVLFSDKTPKAGTFLVADDERAALLFQDRNSGAAHPSLSMLTNGSNSKLLVSNTDNLTTPAWSPDGEMFTFAVIEPPNARWTVKVMSRDGTLLRSFILSPRTATTPYRQLRWTSCQ